SSRPRPRISTRSGPAQPLRDLQVALHAGCGMARNGAQVLVRALGLERVGERRRLAGAEQLRHLPGASIRCAALGARTDLEVVRNRPAVSHLEGDYPVLEGLRGELETKLRGLSRRHRDSRGARGRSREGSLHQRQTGDESYPTNGNAM